MNPFRVVPALFGGIVSIITGCQGRDASKQAPLPAAPIVEEKKPVEVTPPRKELTPYQEPKYASKLRDLRLGRIDISKSFNFEAFKNEAGVYQLPSNKDKSWIDVKEFQKYVNKDLVREVVFDRAYVTTTGPGLFSAEAFWAIDYLDRLDQLTKEQSKDGIAAPVDEQDLKSSFPDVLGESDLYTGLFDNGLIVRKAESNKVELTPLGQEVLKALRSPDLKIEYVPGPSLMKI